jgi:hypothetical protein
LLILYLITIYIPHKLSYWIMTPYIEACQGRWKASELLRGSIAYEHLSEGGHQAVQAVI